ncbi:hypothetical protein [Candidatus Chrysopegis kryptomonas]|uniref:Haemolysin XhlA n=1 Tax=Candidatus Chryseopegocella kryptomonas TaxID=1633643 RepID=A0A0P1MWQ1_9BACT|nr:hypothetical protein [Candidatus Chrysopegis kryptomonas]CUT00487.1 Protein of unknown function (DUF1640) [Candidatus Chrysopegis kryptomonas]
MATIEELEQRVAKIEMFIYEVIREKFNDIDRKFDNIDKKFDEIDKRLISLYEKTERDKTEMIERIESVRVNLIKWMVGLFVAFSTLLITAMWAILNFAMK